VEEKVENYLEWLVEQLRPQLMRARSRPLPQAPQSFSVVGAIKALHAVGLLSDQEHSEWMVRIREVVDASREPATGVASRAVAEGVTPAAAQQVQSVDDVFAFDLRRVVIGPFEPVDRLRLVSVELYADGVALRWNLKTVPGRDLEDQLPEFELHDDLGTSYALRRRRGGGDLVIRGETYFSPAVPDEATRLEAIAGERRFRLLLTS
jgi:hypothetical protein